MRKTAGRKTRGLSQEERALWQGFTRAVAPLRKLVAQAERELEEAPQPKAPKASAVARARAAAPPKPLPPLAPLDRRQRKKLARGKEKIDARLDLHGYSQAQAHDALKHFLRGAQAKRAGVVLVITGKGKKDFGIDGGGTRGEGVLKRAVPLWLKLPEFRDYVIGFEQAAIGHGGEGALYVRLRKKRTA
jgi:DNA-nicking Smr family endonuclease